MKKVFVVAAVFVAISFLTMCKCPPCPDLVPSASVRWDDNAKEVVVTIHNTGSGTAKSFMVYVNADENPVSQNHRPQVSHKVDSLAGCSSITLPLSDFLPLAHPDNFNLTNVFEITVLVDPKNMVAECTGCGENNNEVKIPLP